MVQRIIQAVADYEDRLREMQSLPRFSYGRGPDSGSGAVPHNSDRLHTNHLKVRV